jgi:hypothetical protein
MSLKRFAAAWLFLAANLIAAICFFGGCDVAVNPKVDVPKDTTGGTPVDTLPYRPDTAHDGRLVGDWQTVYDDDDGTAIEITTLTADGLIIEGGFLKVGNFWIESWDTTGTWYTSNDTLYEDIIGLDPGETPPLRYAFAGNRVILNYCLRIFCDTTVSERVDVAAVKSQLGTILGQDLALYANAGYTDLMWRLESDEDEIIDFDMMYFWYGERYFGYDWHCDEDGWLYNDKGRYYDQVWYTAGSRLFLIIKDDGGVEETVELEYGVAGSGTAARLFIRPVLADGSEGPQDVWLPADWEDLDLGLYKSKHVQKAAKKRNSVFKRGGLGKRLAVVR